MKKRRVARNIVVILGVCVLALLIAVCLLRSCYQRPYRNTVEKEELPSALVYAVMKAESDFREDVISRAGAVGLMQMKPATAEFICQREGILYEADRLTEGDYNAVLGCRYLAYLLDKFEYEETALAAYNAGEGTVRNWLQDAQFSADGMTLKEIPYTETKRYVKKVEKFRKIYEILY